VTKFTFYQKVTFRKKLVAHPSQVEYNLKLNWEFLRTCPESQGIFVGEIHTKSSHFRDVISMVGRYTFMRGKVRHNQKGSIRLTTIQATSLSKRKTQALWLVFAVVVLIVVPGWYFYSRRTSGQAAPDSSQTSTTAIVRRGDLVLSATGTATLIAQTEATFGFKKSGQVTQVSVKVGDQVQAGQVLAQTDETLAQMNFEEARQALRELYSAAAIAATQQEIGTAQDSAASARTWLAYLISPDVVDAEKNLATAQQKLADVQAEAKANPSNATEQKVKDAQATVTFLQAKLDQAWAYFKNVYGPETFTEYETVGSGRRRRQVAVTYTDPDTGEELPKIDWPSTDDIATARNNYAQAQQAIKDGQSYLEALETGVIPAGATGAKLNDLINAQLTVQQAKTALDDTKLIAPVDGTITAVNINIGELGNTFSAITIAQLAQPYLLDAHLDQTDWDMAQVGNQVNVTFNLLPDKTFPGIITMVYPQLDSSSESPLVHILVQLDQSISQNLPAGTGANIEVIGGEAQGVLIIPSSAIHQSNDGGYAVYVVQNGQKTEKPVEIGLKGTSYAEVKSGLAVGEIVATK